MRNETSLQSDEEESAMLTFSPLEPGSPFRPGRPGGPWRTITEVKNQFSQRRTKKKKREKNSWQYKQNCKVTRLDFFFKWGNKEKEREDRVREKLECQNEREQNKWLKNHTFHREGSKETTQQMKTLSIETLFKGIGYGFVKQPNLEQV